ncbi:MAG: type II secretion system protein GspD, partial [Burkholderiales bacterium]
TLGVDWIFRNLNNSGLNVTQLGGNTTGASTQFGRFTGFAITQLDRLGQPRAVLNALASDNKVTVLSNPSLIARNGEAASIQVGQDVPILTSQQTNSATGGTGVISSVQYRNTGTILKIKPVIHSSDQVDMEVSQEVSSVASNTTGGISSPTINKSSLDTKLTLKHGSTYVLGGLISNNIDKTRSGVPFLKDIPILGQAFSKTTDSTKRNELVILITPYIISDDGEARIVTDAFRKQLGAWAQEPKPANADAATPSK